jgi:hypothetical protein
MRTAALVLMYVSLALLGTYQAFRPTIESRFEWAQADRGDGMLNHLILENSWLALTDPDYRGSFATAPFCFPERGTIYYSENLFGGAPLYWALRAVLPLDLAYMWWQIVLNALNFVAFAVIARWLRLSHPIAAVGAFLWAFAVVHLDQIKHQQMIGRLWMPVAVYYAFALVAEPSTKAFNRLLGATFLQCLTCFYTGWFLAVGLGTFIPALVLFSRGSRARLKQFVRERFGAIVRITAVWGLAMAALFAPYVLLNHQTGHEYKECHGLLPTPAAWITGPNGSKWQETLSDYSKPKYYECKLFSGFTMYALMLGAAVHLPFLRRDGERPSLWPLAAAGLTTAVVWWLLTVATAPNGESLWRVVRLFPGGKAVRVVARVYVVVYLFGGLGALVWLQMVTDRIGYVGVRAAVLGFVAAALIWEQTGVEQLCFQRRHFYPHVDRAAADLRGAEVGYVVPRFKDEVMEYRGPYGTVFAMWVGMRANVPVVNAYSGVLPKGFPGGGDGANMSDDQIREWLRGRYRGAVRVIDSERPGWHREIVVE